MQTLVLYEGLIDDPSPRTGGELPATLHQPVHHHQQCSSRGSNYSVLAFPASLACMKYVHLRYWPFICWHNECAKQNNQFTPINTVH